MTIANVSLANTFDQWRTVTNQLVVLGNNITENNVLKFVTNSPSLLVTSSANTGEIVSINVSLANTVTDTASANIAAAGAVNTVYTLATQALTVAQAAYGNANTKFTTAGGTITGDVTISGNISIYGGSFRILDPLLYLAANNYSSDTVNIGVVGNYVNTTGSNVHTGIYRNSNSREWYLFQEYGIEPGANNNIDPSLGGFQLATLNANIKTSNITYAGVQLGNLAFTLANTSAQLANTLNVISPTTAVITGNINTVGWLSSTSNVSVGTSLVVGSYANVAANLSVGSNATVGSNITAGGFVSAGGFLRSTQNTSIGTNLTVGANAVVTTFLAVGSYANVTSNLSVGANATVATNAAVGTWLSVGSYANVAANLSVGTFITDSIGNVRTHPVNSQTIPYVLQKTDVGKIVMLTASGATNVFVPNAVFTTGDVVRVFNYSGAARTLTINSNVLLVQANQSPGFTAVNRTFGANGFITIYCVAGVGAGTGISGNTFVVESSNNSLFN